MLLRSFLNDASQCSEETKGQDAGPRSNPIRYFCTWNVRIAFNLEAAQYGVSGTDIAFAARLGDASDVKMEVQNTSATTAQVCA